MNQEHEPRYKQLKATVPLNPCPWCFGTASVFMQADSHESLRFVGCSTVGYPEDGDCCPGFMPIDELLAATAREAIEKWQRLTDPARKAQRPIAKPLEDWHPDMGPVVWWRFPFAAPAYIGTPTDAAWPGCHTHWTPHPDLPVVIDPEVDVPPQWDRPEEVTV